MSKFKYIKELKENPEAESKKVETTLLDSLGRDLTALAKDNKFDPTIGRSKEIEEVITILSRRRKNNPVLIGDPGVGKTAIVEGIAQIISNDEECPDVLKGKRIIELDMASIMIGTSAQGDLEKKVKRIIKELEDNPDVILFIDEIHMIIDSNKPIDVSNMFKPALARGEMRCIGATTEKEYKTIEKDGALDRRFQKISVSEPSQEETIEILTRLKDTYGKFHGVVYSDDAVLACVKLAGKFITDRFFPDKAIDLLDEVGARARAKATKSPEVKSLEKQLHEIGEEKIKLTKAQNFEAAGLARAKEKELQEKLTKLNASGENKINISKADVEKVMARKVDIPELKSDDEDVAKKYLELEKNLKLEIIGQDEVVTKVSKCLRRNAAGLKDPNRPQGVFLFLGSTGTGKCHGRGTKILMFDGSIKNVEDVKVGDLLMGDDSKPRRVISLANGFDDMYRIKYKSGQFTCNSDHVLSLKRTGTYEIVNIPLNEYLNKNKTFKHTHKLWSNSIDFEPKDVSVDPYLIGLWLGDGDKNRVGITTADVEIVNYLKSVANEYDLKLNKRDMKNNKASTYYLTGENWTNNKNKLTIEFRKYGLLDKNENFKKFIPRDYMINSYQVRLSILAGLIDSDGHFNSNCYFISSNNKYLSEQIVYLCRSLGLMARITDKKINKYPENNYYTINISGDLTPLSPLLDRKKPSQRKQKKSVNMYGFEVEHIGKDEYFGFEIDSNNLYVLGDFTVTHNTHTVKTLAKNVFGSESAMIRIDMSEYGEKHNVSRLIGSPPGYVGYNEGGQLTEKVRRKPYSIILLDEVEKAHPDVLTVFLQVFEDGHLTDGQGKKVDFKNTIIVMTSNVGSKAAAEVIAPVGFSNNKEAAREEKTKDVIKKELQSKFAPEFLNRIDDIIVFSKLSKENIHQIIDVEVRKLSKKLTDMGYTLELTTNIKDFLSEQGYDSEMGARPLRRAITKWVEDPISEEILRKTIKDKIVVDYDAKSNKVLINGNQIVERKIVSWIKFK